MVKFCLQCKNAFWGGQYCPKCEGQVELLDAARPENQKYLAELNIDVRPKYFARSSMMLSLFGFVMALPIGMFVFLRGMTHSGNVVLWGSVGVGMALAVSCGVWKLSHWVFGRQMEEVPKDKHPQID
ncbi:MAG: hypothetical protein ACE5GQ_11260 [Nitrospinales bacterium]